MRREIVETVSNAPINRRSAPRTTSCITRPFNKPNSNAASISKSWMCSHAAAPLRRASSQPAGALKRAGATTNTMPGCAITSRISTGKLESAKLAR